MKRRATFYESTEQRAGFYTNLFLYMSLLFALCSFTPIYVVVFHLLRGTYNINTWFMFYKVWYVRVCGIWCYCSCEFDYGFSGHHSNWTQRSVGQWCPAFSCCPIWPVKRWTRPSFHYFLAWTCTRMLVWMISNRCLIASISYRLVPVVWMRKCTDIVRRQSIFMDAFTRKSTHKHWLGSVSTVKLNFWFIFVEAIWTNWPMWWIWSFSLRLHRAFCVCARHCSWSARWMS